VGLRWKFKGPVKIGDTIRLQATVTAKQESSKPECGVITLERRVLNQRDEVVLEARVQRMIRRRVGS